MPEAPSLLDWLVLQVVKLALYLAPAWWPVVDIAQAQSIGGMIADLLCGCGLWALILFVVWWGVGAVKVRRR